MREMSGYHDTVNERMTDSSGRHTIQKTKDTLTWLLVCVCCAMRDAYF